MPYDRNKAATFNRLIQQGVSEDEALNQAGIGDADVGNYAIGMNGQIGPLIVGTGTRNNVEVVRGDPPRSTYDQTPARQVTAVTKTSTQTDSTTAVSGGGTTTIIAGQSKPNANSEAAAAVASAKQAELDQFIKDNPSNFARRRQGLPPLTPEENEVREARRRELEDQVGQAKNNEIDARTPGVPTVINTPNTTTTTRTTTFQTSVEQKPVQYVDDPELEQAQEEAFADESVEPSDTSNTATPPVAVSYPGGTFLFENQAQLDDYSANPGQYAQSFVGSGYTVTKIDPLPTEQASADDDTLANNAAEGQTQVEWYDAEPTEDPYAVAPPEDTPGPTEADLNIDPLSDEAILAQEQAQADNRFDLEVENVGPEPLAPEEDPFEQARQDAEDAYNAEGPTEADLNVDPLSDEAILAQQETQAVNRAALQSEDARDAAATAAFKERAKQQATFQARYKQPGNSDWRVRLSLSPNAQYLYNAGTPRGSAAGILAPLAATDGVIFPYTPSISTVYTANYEQYDLVHSNYRGVYYKNSRVGDINIRGTFTAQDTAEAEYLLAVIHFFRSATKMFYGQDAERGTPPPVCLLNGLGQFQFSDHPVVISSFNYTTPNDVDYIRATNPNNFGSNLLNRRTPVASNPGGSSLAGLNRLLNALPTGLSKGAIPNVPAPGTVNQSVNNTAGATYVPTKMEIDITLIPVQTRAQVSKQFSLKGFANGDLLKGGFW